MIKLSWVECLILSTLTQNDIWRRKLTSCINYDICIYSFCGNFTCFNKIFQIKIISNANYSSIIYRFNVKDGRKLNHVQKTNIFVQMYKIDYITVLPCLAFHVLFTHEIKGIKRKKNLFILLRNLPNDSLRSFSRRNLRNRSDIMWDKLCDNYVICDLNESTVIQLIIKVMASRV